MTGTAAAIRKSPIPCLPYEETRARDAATGSLRVRKSCGNFNPLNGENLRDDNSLDKCSCFVLLWIKSNTWTRGDIMQKTESYRELAALTVMFIAGYACMLVA